MSERSLKVGLFGIGLEAYWPQFAGLEARLRGYIDIVEAKLARPGVEVVNLGLILRGEKDVINHVPPAQRRAFEAMQDRLRILQQTVRMQSSQQILAEQRERAVSRSRGISY